MVKNFELWKESGIFKIAIRAGGFSSTKYIFQSGAGAVSNCGSRIIVPSCRTGTSSEIRSATCTNRCVACKEHLPIKKYQKFHNFEKKGDGTGSNKIGIDRMACQTGR